MDDFPFDPGRIFKCLFTQRAMGSLQDSLKEIDPTPISLQLSLLVVFFFIILSSLASNPLSLHALSVASFGRLLHDEFCYHIKKLPMEFLHRDLKIRNQMSSSYFM